MKIPLAFLLASSLVLGALQAQTSAAKEYSEAQRAYLAGDTETAKTKFQEVLAIDPTNSGAKNYLRTILMAEKKDKKSPLAGQLKTLIVPKVSFKEASLASVLDFLKSKAAEISANKVAPSFVLKLPADFATQTPITLELSNVPFTEILRYLGDLTSTKFDIQEYAIVVTPRT